jgi:hypothetical protein
VGSIIVVRDLRYVLFRASRGVAIAVLAALLVMSVRCWWRTDTLSILTFQFVTHMGQMYIVGPTGDFLSFESEPAAANVDAWPVTFIGARTWAESRFLGFGAWTGVDYAALMFPIPLAFVPPALYLVWWHRRRHDFVRRTYYLACPRCGYLLKEIITHTCPECGLSVGSRVVEALPPRPRPARVKVPALMKHRPDPAGPPASPAPPPTADPPALPQD